MKRLIFCLLILLPAMLEAGTQYLVDYPLMTANGLERRSSKVTMTTSGGFAVFYCENRVVDVWWVGSMPAFDGTWDYDTLKAMLTNNNAYSGARAYGDSAFFITQNDSGGHDDFLLAKWSGVNFSRQIIDSVTYTGYGGVPGAPVFTFMLHGTSKILLLHREETGATDSLFLMLSDGQLTQTTDWVRLDSGLSPGTCYYTDFGWSGGTKGGLLGANIDRSVFWADTVGGFDTLHTSFVPYTGNITTAFNVAQRIDSNGIVAEQMAATSGNDHLYSKRFKASATGAGSGAIVFIDSVKIEDAANCPDGFHWNPFYSITPSGDTVILYYLWWNNAANTDSADIAYKISTDGGETFGSRNILVPAVDGKKRFNLQAPPDIYTVGSNLLLGICWQDSISSNDTLRAFLDSIEVVAISNAVVGIDSTTDEITAEHTYAGFSGVDTVWVFYDTNAVIAGADSTYDATSLGSPDTTTATGLTPETKYYIWSVISYGVASRDTSDIDSLTTTALAVPGAVTGLAIDSVWNDYLPQPNENDIVAFKYTTPNEVGWDSIISIWSTVAYQDSDQTTNRLSELYPGALTFDSNSIIVAITEPDTFYVSIWVWDAVNGYSPRAEALKAYGSSDETPPDTHTGANIIAILNFNPDSISLYVGTVGATDHQYTMIRWDTTAIPDTVTAGNLLDSGGVWADTTFNFLLNGIVEPDWVYITVFAGDEVPNWNAGKTDSVFFPAVEGGVAQTSKMYQYLMGLQGD